MHLINAVINILQKKYVFCWCLKVSRLGPGPRRLSGSEFQVDVGLAKAKRRRPKLSTNNG